MDGDDDSLSSFHQLRITSSAPKPKPRTSLQRKVHVSTALPSRVTDLGEEMFPVYGASSSATSRPQQHSGLRGRGRPHETRTPSRNSPAHHGFRMLGEVPPPLRSRDSIASPQRRSPKVFPDHSSRSRNDERGNPRGNFQARPRSSRSSSRQRPHSVHEAGMTGYNFTNNENSPQHRFHSKRSSSRQRYSNETGQESQEFSPKKGTPRGIGYKAVEEMVNDDSIESKQIAMRLSTESSGFALQLRSSSLHNGWIQLILKLFAKLSKSDDPNQYFNRILVMLIDCNFHMKILTFFQETFNGRVNKENASIHVSNTLLLLRSWLIYVPNSCQLAVDMIFPFLKGRIAILGLANYGDIAELVVEIEQLQQHSNQKEQERNDPATPMNMHDEEPPDDFRSLSVFPTKNDIHDRDPFVRTNLTSSAYRSSDHYLDVQFRLLREDFVRPLREGIRDFLSTNYVPGKKKHRLEGVKMYQGVSIEFPKLSPKGITYCLHFDIDKLKFVQWQNSKRLLFGNLVCLSSDHFTENFLFASITNRTVELLRDGYIEVEFWNIEGTAVGMDNIQDDRHARRDENSACLITSEDMKKTYVMAESEAYFEAYRHVLAGLQETRRIPLRQYIVNCMEEVDSPRYLRGLGRSATYDFSCIVSDSSGGNSIYDVLNTFRWPDAQTLGLDSSQVDALKSALTQELSIIQGPPGTGKTYVGLMIMKILLANKNSNAGRNNPLRVPPEPKSVPNGPILVVCYTNHALDQFLEGISKFHPKGLIRVGGRGKNKELEQYNLSNVRRGAVTDKFMRKTFYTLRCDLETQVTAVEKSQAILKASTDSILGLQELMSVIPSHHYEDFEKLAHRFKIPPKKALDKALLQWLGVSKKIYQVSEGLSYVIEETLDVVVQHYVPYMMQRNRVLQAIVCTGDLDADILLSCLIEHNDHEDIEPVVNSDIVFKYLDDYQVQVDMDMFRHMGFHYFEVKCACFVLASSPQPMMQRDFTAAVVDWINEKRVLKAEVENVGFVEEVEGANVEEEANYVEDQRMIDSGDGDFMMQIERRGHGRNQNPRFNENVFAVKHDNIHFEADFTDGLDDGFQFQRSQAKRMQKDLQRRMKKEMTKQDVLSDYEVKTIQDIFSLSPEKKWKLYRYWVRKLLAIHRKNISERSTEYNRLTKALNDMRNQEALQVLQTADVIAMTTTGAAKYRDMIYKLPVRIMIVEEAAEVLEAHIVTSMPETTEHLILIGDHQQLKPSPTVYELAVKYQLEMSLFERMIKNGIPCSKLELQHRMRPRIADLIRPHIYEVLRDNLNVKLYDDVIGVKSNVFFLSHKHLENNDSEFVRDSRSKVNQHEADFMIGLCRYLLQQGYEPDRITILTAYVGQLLAFKKAVARKLDKRIRITAVDNFQGEENDIILLSLVRSNQAGKIGFLSIENRVCVALSRAKKGLYCIGNFELLKEKSKLWRKILAGLERDDLTGDAMPLQCKNHPETIIKVKCQADFEKVPEGGCGKPCMSRLDCGHVCARLCHPNDSEHKKYVCRKETEKECPLGHKTKLKCFQKLDCKVLVEKLMPICNHYMDVPCNKDPATVTCTKPCEKKLGCGHKCANPCGVKCSLSCTKLVEIDAACGHRVKVACGRKHAFNVNNCEEKCNELLKCGHPCKGTCGKCKQGRLHVGCNHPKCGRVLCCGHICQEACTSVCPPCRRKCETSCRHSKCPKQCCEPCVLCTEKCGWECEHYKCTKKCSEPCNRPPCNKPCQKTLKCHHPCIGLCGEPCPKLCRICDKDKVEEIFFGDEDEPDARFVQLDCGHIFTYEGLDRWMEQKNMDDSSESDIKLNECPRCKTPIRKSTRYGNIVNKTLISINEVREKISGTVEEVHANREALLDGLRTDHHFRAHYSILFEEIKKSVMSAKSNPALSVVEVQYDCLSEFATIKEKLRPIQSAPNLISLKINLENRMKNVEQWLMRKRFYFSEQEIEDLSQERQRCKDVLKYIQVKQKIDTISLNTSNLENIKKTVDYLEKYLINDLYPYQAKKQSSINRAFKLLDKLVPSLLPGLGITDDERKMILKAIDLSPGHWFKCKNGHVYCIGECGGAMETSKCPECNADIGGTSHTLNPTNRLASEMDGAQVPTWNPNNFDIPAEVREWMRGGGI